MPEFVLVDRSRLLEAIELLNLISDAVSNDTPKLIACLLRIQSISLGHASRLEDHVGEHAKVRNQDQHDHPKRFAPAGNVMTPEQVAEDGDEQPEPYDEHEYREDVG